MNAFKEGVLLAVRDVPSGTSRTTKPTPNTYLVLAFTLLNADIPSSSLA